MVSKRLKLPIGIQTFEELRNDGYVYVDKTKYLINMIDTGKIYFLARPRRFGKSITVSTFVENKNYIKPFPNPVRVGIAIDDAVHQITH